MRTFVFITYDAINPPERSTLQLVDLQAARIEAARLLGAMITHEPENFWQAKVWRLAVEDFDGLGLFQLHASAVEAPDTGHRPIVERI